MKKLLYMCAGNGARGGRIITVLHVLRFRVWTSRSHEPRFRDNLPTVKWRACAAGAAAGTSDELIGERATARTNDHASVVILSYLALSSLRYTRAQ
jgi:hypothetical protein